MADAAFAPFTEEDLSLMLLWLFRTALWWLAVEKLTLELAGKFASTSATFSAFWLAKLSEG